MARIQKDSNFPRYREWYLTCPGMTSPLIPLMLIPAKRSYLLVGCVGQTGGSGSAQEGNTTTREPYTTLPPGFVARMSSPPMYYYTQEQLLTGSILHCLIIIPIRNLKY
jgi:hypothetical protein